MRFLYDSSVSAVFYPHLYLEPVEEASVEVGENHIPDSLSTIWTAGTSTAFAALLPVVLTT